MQLIGRHEEVRTLERLYNSNVPEFLALYGRRRIGKTYLIRNFFKNKDLIFFNVTGAKNSPMKEQIKHFTEQMSEVFYKGIHLQPGKNWDETFKLLTRVLKEQAPLNKKIVLFFDELPWMATQNSRLLEALDYYWNQHWSNDPRIKLIVCGSSASWIINKIINNKGGLHNRITKQIYLQPFDLLQTQEFLSALGIKLNNKQVLLLFMVTGGVPYYLSQIEKGLSASQAIARLAFSKNSFFLNEFNNLFSSLFDDGDDYIKIINLIAENRYGLSEKALLERLGSHALGYSGQKKLRDLEQTGFIIRFKALYHKKRGIYYRLTDEYTLFYLKWLQPMQDFLQKESLGEGNWQALQTTPEWYSWLGYAFESVCYKHLDKIKKSLKLNPSAVAGTWRYVPRKGSIERGAQIDLLFDRKDDAITICEIKYSDEPFILTKEYVEALNRKLKVFREQTKTKKQLFIALICANGLKNNYYAEDLLSGVVVLDDFYKES